MQKKSNIKTAKGRKISSTKWLYRHINDPYVSMANEAGYRSRAAFKLIEINEKFKIFSAAKKDCAVIDLGCAPGSWLQVLSKKLNPDCKIIGVDLKEIDCNDINNAVAITGDFTDPKTLQIVKEEALDKNIKLIISDMAPNSCGDKQTDHIRITVLANEVLDFVAKSCAKGGNAVIKVIQGNMSKDLNDRAKSMFTKINWYKPKSSYADSAEIYLVMLGLK
jgi:23S rRNA (uridine2552-2'-O)-methyltransferase